MFRICKAEFKKLFYKPSIYIFAGLLIFVLACCSFIYQPSNRDNVYVEPKATSTTVQAFYNELNDKSDYASKNALKEIYKEFTSAEEFLDKYRETPEKPLIEYKQSLYDEIDVMVAQYQKFLDSLQVGSSLNTETERENFIQSFKTFLTNYKDYVYTGDNQEIHILTTSKLDNNIKNYLNESILDMENAANRSDDVNEYIRTRVGSKFRTILTGYVDQLIDFIPEQEYVNSLDAYIEQSRAKITTIKAEIDEFAKTHNDNTENVKTSNINTLAELATRYKLQCEQTLQLVTNGIYLNALRDYSQDQLNGFYGLENFNFYEANEEQARLLFYFENDTCSIDYANPFSISQPSNFSLNCYDFSYFALRLCMFIIIIYVVTVAATTITGELQAGTMKLLAIRPYKREKILAGKLLSTLLIGIVLMLVSSVATLVMGFISYGGASLPVLVVFNSANAVAMSPILLYVIMIFTLIIEMTFFVLLALAISLLFKSQVGSVAVSILAFFGTLVLNTLLGKASWLVILPFTNINLYKYFGSSFISTSGGFVESVLTSPVATGASFWLSFIYTAVSIIGLLVLVFEVFKRRDMK